MKFDKLYLWILLRSNILRNIYYCENESRKKSLYVAMCLIFVQKSSVKHVYDYATLFNFYVQFSTR